MRWRFVIGALIALAAYALLASVDGLEYWVEITEEYEHLELDELPLIFVFLFGWYAWVLFEQNRERKQMLEFLRAEVSEKELAREVARQALDARTAFFTSMNHDFRTPLNSIIGFSDLMTSEKLGEHAVPQYREYSQYINDAGTLLLSTVNRMMDISTIMNDSEIRVQEQTFAVLPEIRTAVQLSNGHSNVRSRFWALSLKRLSRLHSTAFVSPICCTIFCPMRSSTRLKTRRLRYRWNCWTPERPSCQSPMRDLDWSKEKSPKSRIPLSGPGTRGLKQSKDLVWVSQSSNRSQMHTIARLALKVRWALEHGLA